MVLEMDAMTGREWSWRKAAIPDSRSDSGVVSIALTARLFFGPAFPTTRRRGSVNVVLGSLKTAAHQIPWVVPHLLALQPPRDPR